LHRELVSAKGFHTEGIGIMRLPWLVAYATSSLQTFAAAECELITNSTAHAQLRLPGKSLEAHSAEGNMPSESNQAYFPRFLSALL
jgi:hypothetical protein